MKRRLSLLLCLLLCVQVFTGCCSHEWEEANCEQPRTCIECGREEGEKGDHDWKKATCEHPKTCTVCGKEKGDLGDHKWKDATGTEPETCKYCGKTWCEANGHSWEGTTCRDCGYSVPAAEAAPVYDGSLDIYPEDFLVYFLEYAGSFSSGYTMGKTIEQSDDWFICYVNYNGESAFKLLMMLNSAGYVRDITVQQLRADIPVGDLVTLYTVAVAMNQPDPGSLTDLYSRLDSAMATQDVREDTVYETYELEGYYVQVWRKGADDQALYEVEVFRPTEF